MSYKNLNKWPPALVQDIAIGVDSTSDILRRHCLTTAEYDELWDNPVFSTEVMRNRADLIKTGYTFKAKAQLLAEHHLKTVSDIIDDPETPPDVVVKAMDKLAEWAGLSVKSQPAASTNISGNNVQVIFNFDPGVK